MVAKGGVGDRASRAAIVVLTLLSSKVVTAAPLPSLNLSGLRPPLDRLSGLVSETSVPEGQGEFHSALHFGYANSAVTLRRAGDDSRLELVQHQFLSDIQLVYGLSNRLTLGIDLPLVLYQTGDESPRSLDPAFELAKSGLGDVRLAAKYSFLSREDTGGIALAFLGAISAPSGNASSTLGEDALKGELGALSEIDFVLAKMWGKLGLTLRSEERTFLGERFGHELPWAFGLMVKPQFLGWDHEGIWQVALEVAGHAAVEGSFFNAETSPVALFLSARQTYGELSLIVGGGLPLNSAIGNALTANLGLSWAPRSYDLDNDGFDDDEDQCVTLAEDFDDFQDRDGCPDPDNDADGVLDRGDECPTTREDTDGFQDDDGCPDVDNDKDGVADIDDLCKNEPGLSDPLLGRLGCPAKDRDRDGIIDPLDACPRRAEDADGFADADGCPDADNDGDGIRDSQDACPNEAALGPAAGEDDSATPESQRPHAGAPGASARRDNARPDDATPDAAKKGAAQARGCPAPNSAPIPALTPPKAEPQR